jgi:hypothetical protein
MHRFQSLKREVNGALTAGSNRGVLDLWNFRDRQQCMSTGARRVKQILAADSGWKR